MSLNIIKETQFLLHAGLLGIGITFAYDWLRILRKVIKHSDFFVSIEDFFYWIGCSYAVFLVLHYENDGVLRWFAIIGAAIGMLLYKLTVGTIFVKVMTAIGCRVWSMFRKLLKVVCRPFGCAVNSSLYTCKKGGRKGKKYLRMMKKKLTIWMKVVRIILCKQ